MKKYMRKAILIISLGLSLSLLMAGCHHSQSSDKPAGTDTLTAENLNSGESAAEESTSEAEAGSTMSTQSETGEAAGNIAPLPENTLLGAAAAKQDNNLEIATMLRYALEDEYLARDEYTKIMAVFGEIRPFVNIREAEKNHISMLLPLFEAYELPLPEYETASTSYSGTLQEAYTAGVQAEIENIAMYERFLHEDLPEDIRSVFEKLLNASEKHLKAFERGV